MTVRTHLRQKLSPIKAAQARENGKLGGRPKGSVNPGNIALRGLCRAKDVEHVSYLQDIAANDKSGAVRISAIRELFERGHGRAPQPIDGNGQGDPITIQVITGVPTPDDWRSWDVASGT